MSMEAQLWRGSPNIPLTGIHPQVMFGQVALGLGAGASGAVPPGEFGFPVSNDWLLGSMAHLSFLIMCSDVAGGSFEILVSGDGATAVFTLWQAYALTGTASPNVMVDIPVAGWAMRINIINNSAAGANFTGLVCSKSIV